MVNKHDYYMRNRESILSRIDQNKITKKDLYNEIESLNKRISNLKIIIEGKDKYIEDLRKLINELKSHQK